MTSTKGRVVHQQALDTLENGDYLKSLQLEDEALLIYENDHDDAGFAEILAMRLLSLNMLGDKTGDKKYYILAMHEAMASLELAEQTNSSQQIALGHAAVGRAMDRAEKYKEAADHFDRAIEELQKTAGGHNRKSVIADFKNHAATSRLRAGDLSQEALAVAALKELELSGDASDHEMKVWKTGGLIRLAIGMNKNGNKVEAKKYLEEAKTIAMDDSSLKVRLEQIEMLQNKIGIN